MGHERASEFFGGKKNYEMTIIGVNNDVLFALGRKLARRLPVKSPTFSFPRVKMMDQKENRHQTPWAAAVLATAYRAIRTRSLYNV